MLQSVPGPCTLLLVPRQHSPYATAPAALAVEMANHLGQRLVDRLEQDICRTWLLQRRQAGFERGHDISYEGRGAGGLRSGSTPDGFRRRRFCFLLLL